MCEPMEVARKPSPILVIGKNRSGTKWVSNLLANHSSIRAVQAPQHGGIIETNFFGMMQQVFGDIGRVENYIAAVEACLLLAWTAMKPSRAVNVPFVLDELAYGATLDVQ